MKPITIIEWSALVITLTGALLTSLHSLYPLYPYNLFALFTGCALYIVWAVMIKRTSLIWLNSVLGAMHGIGIIAWFISTTYS